MKYRKGYDGQVAETFQILLPETLHPEVEVSIDYDGIVFINLETNGVLTITAGYSWDFASVPITKKFSNWVQGKKSKTPSLVHDALCQLYRNDLLTMPGARQHADLFFYHMLLGRGFWKIRAWAWYKAVYHWGKKHKQEPKPILEAP